MNLPLVILVAPAGRAGCHRIILPAAIVQLAFATSKTAHTIDLADDLDRPLVRARHVQAKGIQD
jgi:hypothetical protein